MRERPCCDPDNAEDYELQYSALLDARSADDNAGSSLPPSQGTSLPPSQQRVATEYHTALTQGMSDEAEDGKGFCRDVVDMMRIATMCHRHHMGDFIWVSWVPSKQRPSRIGHGSQCLMLTKFGFFCLTHLACRSI